MGKALYTKDMEPREMTNPEIRALRKAGFHPHYAENPGQVVEDFTDYILDNIYPDVDFSKAGQKACLTFAAKTFEKTYGDSEEVKNS